MTLIWATRGHTWGFRFLLSGGFDDPLLEFERVFEHAGIEPNVAQRVGNSVALRFPDPLSRTDAAGRRIIHEFVVHDPLSAEVDSVDDGLRLIWPLVEERFERVWDQDEPDPL